MTFSARDQARSSAAVILPLVLELIQPRSVVDVGCGDGVWLEALQDREVDVLGLDGEWARDHLRISSERFLAVDLAQPFQLDRNFDLAISLQVAEHLPPESSAGFVASLTAAAPTILFSAAVPGQKGTHHINLQWPQYWAELFAQHGFVPIDCLRRRVWSDKRVSGAYSQNAMIFVQRDRLEHLPALEREAAGGFPSPPSLVHPEVFAAALGAAKRRERRARANADPGVTRKPEKTVTDLRESTARADKLEKRALRLERRLADLQRSRWFRLGHWLGRARAGRTPSSASDDRLSIGPSASGPKNDSVIEADAEEPAGPTDRRLTVGLTPYLTQRGWVESARRKESVDRDGAPVPWITYSAMDFLARRVKDDLVVFEFGSGNSTLWWADRVSEVTAVEHDLAWASRVSVTLPANATVSHVALERAGNYSKRALETQRRFDIIVVDGRDRVNCALTSLEALSPRGVMIWDNTERRRYRKGTERLRALGFRRIEFTGLAPIGTWSSETSIFYRADNCLRI